MYNYVNLIGRIVRDCEVRKTQGGQSVCDFSVATSERIQSPDGQRNEMTTYINCVAWRQPADFLGVYGKKGRLVQVVGKIKDASYTDRNGVKHYVTKVEASSVNMLDRKREEPSKEYYQEPQKTYEEPVEVYDEDLPF